MSTYRLGILPAMIGHPTHRRGADGGLDADAVQPRGREVGVSTARELQAETRTFDIALVRPAESAKTRLGIQTSDTTAIEAAIQVGRKMLEWPPGWDGEEAAPYAEETFDRAVAFVRTHSRKAARLGKRLPPPQILPGSDGSIDILWEAGAFELLINFPPGSGSIARFYGDDRRGTEIRGSVDTRENPDLDFLPWLIRT